VKEMKIWNAAMIRILLLSTSVVWFTACTTILTETTGDDGFTEDPTQRSAGTVLDDESIETRVTVNMRSSEPAFRDASFSVNSHNGVVLLVGQVPNERLKQLATDITADTSSRIRRIHNELEIGAPRGVLTRSGDTWLATKVRTQLVANSDITSSRIRVIANNGRVFLMGIVDRDEGEQTARLVRNVGGVEQVVTVFEYL
jgi:osmotically-inducible protein OsmY